MTTVQIILGVVQIVVCLILIAVIMLQSGRAAYLSGVIAGGAAETFFGKNKAKTMEGKLEKWTTIVAVTFIILTLVLDFMFK